MRELIQKSIKALGVEYFAVNPDANDKESFDNSYIEYNKKGEVSLEKGTPTITWDQVDAKSKEIKAEYDAQEYARKREAEYPTIQECVHAILDDDLTALQEKRQAIKTKYPKS